MANKETKATITKIQWNATRYGILMPILRFPRRTIDNIAIDRVWGYSAKYLKNNGVAVGARILASKNNDNRLKAIEVLSRASDKEIEKLWNSMTTCPHCGHPVVWSDNGTHLVCRNEKCKGRKLSQLLNFYNTIGLQGIHSGRLVSLFNQGYDSISKMLNLTLPDFLNTKVFNPDHLNRFLKLNASIKKGVELCTLIVASGCFEHMSFTITRKLLKEMSEYERWAFINGYLRFNPEYFESKEFKHLTLTKQKFLRGVIPFYDFVAENNLIILPLDTQPMASSKYKDMTVYLYGGPTKYLEERLLAGGGNVCDKVSTRTTHVVVSNNYPIAAKALKKAVSLGIPILTIDEMEALLQTII